MDPLKLTELFEQARTAQAQDSPRKLSPDRRPNRGFFVADILEWAPKDDRHSMDRLVDPDQCLRERIPEFVMKGEFGLASGGDPVSGFSKIWFKEPMRPDEVAFDPDVYLLSGAKAKALKLRAEMPSVLGGDEPAGTRTEPVPPQEPVEVVPASAGKQQIRIAGAVSPEVWNRLGTKLIPKLKAGVNLKLGLIFTLELEGAEAQQVIGDLRQAIEDLRLSDTLKIERG